MLFDKFKKMLGKPREAETQPTSPETKAVETTTQPTPPETKAVETTTQPPLPETKTESYKSTPTISNVQENTTVTTPPPEAKVDTAPITSSPTIADATPVSSDLTTSKIQPTASAPSDVTTAVASISTVTVPPASGLTALLLAEEAEMIASKQSTHISEDATSPQKLDDTSISASSTANISEEPLPYLTIGYSQIKRDTYSYIQPSTIEDPKAKGTGKKIPQNILEEAIQSNNQAIAAKKQKDVVQAEASYNHAIERYPQYAVAYYNRGLLHTEQGKFDLALEDYNQAIAINPREPEFFNNRGNVYFQKKQLEEALADYNQAITLFPNFSDAYHNRAILYAKQSRWDDAIKDMKRVLELNTDLILEYYNLACLYACKEDINNALAYLEKALLKGYSNLDLIRRDPDLAILRTNPAYHDMIASIEEKVKILKHSES